MKKKMISLLLILALCLGMTISVSAGDTGGFANEYCRVQDQAAFQTFVNLCDKFITQARSGEPFGGKSLPREPLSPIWILISLGVGVVLSLIIVGRMKAQLKTVRFQTTAGSYVKDGSLDITESRDMFLYETISKTKKEKKSSSGGSSTHTSSSGRTHGGGSSKF